MISLPRPDDAPLFDWHYGVVNVGVDPGGRLVYKVRNSGSTGDPAAQDSELVMGDARAIARVADLVALARLVSRLVRDKVQGTGGGSDVKQKMPHV